MTRMQVFQITFLLLLALFPYTLVGYRLSSSWTSTIGLSNHFFGSKYTGLSWTSLQAATDSSSSAGAVVVKDETERKALWKKISQLEKRAIELLTITTASSNDSSTVGISTNQDEAYQLLAESIVLKNSDPFIALSNKYKDAVEQRQQEEVPKIFAEMKSVGLPPHIAGIVSPAIAIPQAVAGASGPISIESVELGSTFSDTVTENIRVKVSSFYDAEKSIPAVGKFLFWYKVAIYNESPETVQVVGRMWEIEKCVGEKEVFRGTGIKNKQPIIAPGDVYTYESACPLKIFPPRGKRVLGSMSGAYTLCKGNMGQHTFSAKVSKFNFIIPPKVAYEGK